MTRRRAAILFLVLLFLLPAAGASWLLYTEGGARWLLAMARGATDNALGYGDASGSVARGLTIIDLQFEADGVGVASNRLDLQASITVLPIGVNLAIIDVHGLDIDLADSEPRDEAGTDPRDLLESLQLPFRLNVDSLAATDVDVKSAGETIASAARVTASAAWEERIELRSFEIDTGLELRASGEASLGLEAPFATRLDVALAGCVPGLPGPVDGSATLSGTLDALEIGLVETVRGLEVTGRVDSLLDAVSWDLEGGLREARLDSDGAIRIQDASLVSAGNPDSFRLESRLSIPGLIDAVPVTVEARATGSVAGLDIEVLRVEHPALDARTAGRLEFPADYSGSVDLRRLHLNQWVAGLEESLLLQGTSGLVVGPAKLSLDSGRFALNDSPMAVEIDGTVDLEEGDIDAVLEWQLLRWPLTAGVATVESRTGSARVTGTLDAWRAEAAATLSAPDIAEGRLALDAEGARQSVAIEITDGEVFGGRIGGSAKADWEQQLRWSGEARVTGLRTAALLPAYPGILTMRLEAGNNTPSGAVEIELVDLRGTLLDEPLSGSGRLSLAGGALAAENFSLNHGEALLEVDGELYAASGLDFELSVPDLALYRPTFSGDLGIAGSLSLKPDAPSLSLDGESRTIRMGAWGIDGLQIRTIDNVSGGVDLELDAAGLTLGERRVEQIDVDASINPDHQRITLRMLPLGNDVTITAEGGLREPGTLTGFPWLGTLEEFSLVTRDGEGGGLDAPVPLELGPDRVVIEGLCLSGEYRGELCAGLVYDESGHLAVEGDIAGVPIDVLNAFLQTGFVFEQTVSGGLRFDAPRDAAASASIDLRFSPGQLKSERFPGLDLRTGEGEFAVEIADGQLRSGRIELPLGSQGFIDGEFNVADIARGGASPVSGSLSARTSDIDVFAVLLPDIEGARGHFQADLAFSGSVSQPVVTGTATLEDGAANYFPLGMALTDIDLEGRFDQNRRIELNGTFRAGDGEGQITTSTGALDDELAGVHVKIRGNRLRLVDLPDVMAEADADLTVDYAQRRLEINGAVDIPRARIRPVNLATGRVDESSDVVIVSGSLPEEESGDEAPPDLSVFGKLALGVGDDVQVILDVATASIDGRADFEWDGDPVPTGRGRYNINGTVEAFGQVLDISEGRVSFPNVPATDPLLDIRATRDIYGNTQIKRAGVLVQGSVRQPTIQAYTYPITTEERALTLLVTGNDFDYEQGVGAIDFGTYIAPRLFLSYGVGVFDRENIVSARYDLSTGFGIRATSGSRESGVDLTYRLER